MAGPRPHQIVLCIASLLILSACVMESSALQRAKSSQCHDEATLENNHKTLIEVQQSYCTLVLSNLAPKAPEGVQPQWTRENPYPALPDYYLYPDTSPMQINAKRLQRVASCMHKRCLKLTQNPKNYCREPDCIQNKGHTIIEIFLKLAQVCTAEPYTKRRAVENIRHLYSSREAKPIQLCESKNRPSNLDLKVAFNQRVNACLPNQNQCPVDYSCIPEAIGFRCRPLKPLPPPVIPGIEFPTTAQLKDLQARCQLSSECQDSLVCGIASDTYSVCSLPCDSESKCPLRHHCYRGVQQVPFCTESCMPNSKEDMATKKNQDRVCIPDQLGGRYIDIPAEQWAQAVTGHPAQGINNTPSKGVGQRIENLIQSFDTAASCGNGKTEPPEECDSGINNGKPNLGAWCTTSCRTAECGNNIREFTEACECTIDYEQAFAQNEELSRIYLLPTTCPGRHALTDGSEKALGFACHSCAIVHGRHMRDTRHNPYFLPEFDPFNPPNAMPGAKSPE